MEAQNTERSVDVDKDEDTKATTQTSPASTAALFLTYSGRQYATTILGLLQLAATVLCFLAFVCAVSWSGWRHDGGAWVALVAFFAGLFTFLLYLAHIFNVYNKVPIPVHTKLEIAIVYFVLASVCFFTASIVAAIRSSWHASTGATTFFAFVGTIVFIVTTVHLMLVYYKEREQRKTMKMSATTTEAVSKGPDNT